jgi:hypothetical protein
MATPRLVPAKPGDTLSLNDLASAVDLANTQAAALNAALAQAQQAQQATPAREADAAHLAELRRQRDAFSLSALTLSTQAITLQAGEARIGAEHIASAVAAAREALEAIADVNQSLATLRAVLDFLAAVISGQGNAIVDSARQLKTALDG